MVQKSCTAWYGKYHIIYYYIVFYIPGGAGFLPSTVLNPCFKSKETQKKHGVSIYINYIYGASFISPTTTTTTTTTFA